MDLRRLERVFSRALGRWIRGDILQGHVAATCSSDKILWCTHSGDIKQGSAAGTCSWGKITAPSHTRKCCGDIPQGRVAVTRPLVRVHTIIFVSATRILLQFRPRDMSHEVKGRDNPSCALLCKVFMQQNPHFSQSQTTTIAFGRKHDGHG